MKEDLDVKREQLPEITPEQEEENSGLLGPSQSREEILARQKEEKAKARAMQKAQRKAAKVGIREHRNDIIMVSVFVVVLVLICGVLLFVQIYQDKQADRFEYDETRGSFFSDLEAKPELTQDGITAAVTGAYYTKGGYLCVELNLGNGLDKDQHLKSLEVKIKNGNTDELIAGGYTAKIAEEYVVPAKDYNTYTFYISPEHVNIKDDPLTRISYTITAKGQIISE